MIYKALLAGLAALILAAGCGKSETTTESAGASDTSKSDGLGATPDVNSSGSNISGTYVATAPNGQTMTVTIGVDGTFSITSSVAQLPSGKGKYTLTGKNLSLEVTEANGKPTTDKQPLQLTVSEDGSTLDGPGDMDFKKQ